MAVTGDRKFLLEMVRGGWGGGGKQRIGGKVGFIMGGRKSLLT